MFLPESFEERECTVARSSVPSADPIQEESHGGGRVAAGRACQKACQCARAVCRGSALGPCAREGEVPSLLVPSSPALVDARHRFPSYTAGSEGRGLLAARRSVTPMYVRRNSTEKSVTK